MEAYIERMVEEKRELDERIQKLVAFRYSDKGDELLNEKQMMLLDEQLNAMEHYHRILAARIEYEKTKTEVIDSPTDCEAPRPPRNVEGYYA